jgi:Mrp family chromosome partitioning ATPase
MNIITVDVDNELNNELKQTADDYLELLSNQISILKELEWNKNDPFIVLVNLEKNIDKEIIRGLTKKMPIVTIGSGGDIEGAKHFLLPASINDLRKRLGLSAVENDSLEISSDGTIAQTFEEEIDEVSEFEVFDDIDIPIEPSGMDASEAPQQTIQDSENSFNSFDDFMPDIPELDTEPPPLSEDNDGIISLETIESFDDNAEPNTLLDGFDEFVFDDGFDSISETTDQTQEEFDLPTWDGLSVDYFLDGNQDGENEKNINESSSAFSPDDTFDDNIETDPFDISNIEPTIAGDVVDELDALVKETTAIAKMPPEPIAHPKLNYESDEHLCPLIISTGGSGGLTKTTTAINLAQRAAVLAKENKKPLYRVCLMDGNIHQGSVRKNLLLQNAPVPTVYDLALKLQTIYIESEKRQAVLDTIIKPDDINEYRKSTPNVDTVDFALVLAPPGEINDNQLVTPEFYNYVINVVRSVSDLVILDTEELKLDSFNDPMPNELNQIILPQLRTNDAYLLGMFTSGTQAPAEELYDVLEALRLQSIPKSKLFIKGARMQSRDAEISDETYQSKFPQGTFVGLDFESEGIREKIKLGLIVHDDHMVSKAGDKVLRTITGFDFFKSDKALDEAQAVSVFRKLLGRKKGQNRK